MTKQRYFSMCEQMGKKPKEEEIPPDWEDFPVIVQSAVEIFNTLGDRVFPEIGYMGKDYTNLPLLIEIYNIEDKELLLELLTWLDARAIKQSSEKLKREYDKLKRTKTSGTK